MTLNDLEDRIRSCLSPDLLKPQYKELNERLCRRGVNTWGHCYVACEALYWLGAKEAGFTPRVSKVWGGTHWWLQRGDEILDPTWDQWEDAYPYDTGRKCAFLTKEPSKRARILMERVSLCNKAAA